MPKLSMLHLLTSMVYNVTSMSLSFVNISLQVAFDWNTLLHFTLPRSLFNATCGLCQGVPISGPVLSVSEWGMAWSDRDIFCQVGCGDSCPRCGTADRGLAAEVAAPAQVTDAVGNIDVDGNPGNRFHLSEGLYAYVEPEAVRLCGLIIDRGGVFARCHSKVAPAYFYQSCLQDTCVDQGAKETICNWLQIYASTCQTQGVSVTAWRSSTPCGEKDNLLLYDVATVCKSLVYVSLLFLHIPRVNSVLLTRRYLKKGLMYLYFQ